MELLVAIAIGVLTAAGIYLVLRQRTFPVIIGISLLTYAVNVFLFASGRLAVGLPPVRIASRKSARCSESGRGHRPRRSSSAPRASASRPLRSKMARRS